MHSKAVSSLSHTNNTPSTKIETHNAHRKLFCNFCQTVLHWYTHAISIKCAFASVVAEGEKYGKWNLINWKRKSCSLVPTVNACFINIFISSLIRFSQIFPFMWVFLNVFLKYVAWFLTKEFYEFRIIFLGEYFQWNLFCGLCYSCVQLIFYYVILQKVLSRLYY